MKIGILGFGRFGQFLAETFSKYHNISAYSRSDYTSIAEKYNTSAKKIREWNKMKPGSSAIYPGQKLVLFTE